MPITSLTSYFNTSSFGDQNTYTRNQDELALTLDSAAHELSNWKSLISMSAGGAGYEGGRLIARVLLGATPFLGALPVLAPAFTFLLGAVSDTGLTRVINHFLENGGEENESFVDQLMNQGGVRGMGVLGLGQSFVVVQLLQGLASVSREAICEANPKKKSGFLNSLLLGLQCHFGSGMFAGFTGGVVAAVEQRISLKTRNMPPRNLGKTISDSFAEWGDKLGLSPLLAQGIRGGIRATPPEESGMMSIGGSAPDLSPPLPPARWAELKRNIFSLTHEESGRLLRWYVDLPHLSRNNPVAMQGRALMAAVVLIHPNKEISTFLQSLDRVDSQLVSSEGLPFDPSPSRLQPLIERAVQAREYGLAAGYAILLLRHEDSPSVFSAMHCHSSPPVRLAAYARLNEMKQPHAIMERWLNSAAQGEASDKELTRKNLTSEDPLVRMYALKIVRIVLEAGQIRNDFLPHQDRKYLRALRCLEKDFEENPSQAFNPRLVRFLIEMFDHTESVEQSVLELEIDTEAATYRHVKVVEGLLSGESWNLESLKAFLILQAMRQIPEMAKRTRAILELPEHKQESLIEFVESGALTKNAFYQWFYAAVAYENWPLVRAYVDFAFRMQALDEVQTELLSHPHSEVQKIVSEANRLAMRRVGVVAVVEVSPAVIALFQDELPITRVELETLGQRLRELDCKDPRWLPYWLISKSLVFLGADDALRARARDLSQEIFKAREKDLGEMLSRAPFADDDSVLGEIAYRLREKEYALASATAIYYLERLQAKEGLSHEELALAGEEIFDHEHPAIRRAAVAYSAYSPTEDIRAAGIRGGLIKGFWRTLEREKIEVELNSFDPGRRKYAELLLDLYDAELVDDAHQLSERRNRERRMKGSLS